MENVLVIKRELLGDIVSRNGLITGREQEVMDLIQNRGEFIPRPQAEADPGYKQIIPYVAILQGDSVFTTTRLARGGEARLHGRMSLGIGGHMNEVDRKDDWLMHCLRREMAEEVSMESCRKLTLRGLINDDSNEVGSVHLGFFFTAETDGPVQVLETEKLSGAFEKLSALEDLYPRMESWSQIVIPELKNLWTLGKL